MNQIITTSNTNNSIQEPGFFSKLMDVAKNLLAFAQKTLSGIMSPPSESAQIDKLARKLNDRFGFLSPSLVFSHSIDTVGAHKLLLTVKIPGCTPQENADVAKEILPFVSPLRELDRNFITHKASDRLGLSNIGMLNGVNGIGDINNIIRYAELGVAEKRQAAERKQTSAYVLEPGEYEQLTEGRFAKELAVTEKSTQTPGLE